MTSRPARIHLGTHTIASALAFHCVEIAVRRTCNWNTKLAHAQAVKCHAALVSSAHDLVGLATALTLFAQIQHAQDQPTGILGLSLHAHIPFKYIDRAGCLFLGFLIWDILYTLRFWNVLGAVDVMFHHFTFLAMVVLNKDTDLCNYAFPVSNIAL